MGLEFVTKLPPIKAIKTKPAESSLIVDGVIEELEEVVTPKSEGSRLKPLLVCPPAPRKKQRFLKRKLHAPRPHESFVDVPCDLESVFVAISSQAPTKKIKAAG